MFALLYTLNSDISFMLLIFLSASGLVTLTLCFMLSKIAQWLLEVRPSLTLKCKFGHAALVSSVSNKHTRAHTYVSMHMYIPSSNIQVYKNDTINVNQVRL